MTPADFYRQVLLPCSSWLPDAYDTLESRVLLFAAAGHESGWKDRLQIGGQGRGYWQFDQTGVIDVLGNPVTADHAQSACLMWDVPVDEVMIYQALAWHDPLAYEFARILLLADPAPLPAVGDSDGAWAVYDRCWRPGAPRETSWAALYAQAVAIVK